MLLLSDVLFCYVFIKCFLIRICKIIDNLISVIFGAWISINVLIDSVNILIIQKQFVTNFINSGEINQVKD